jgi:hypothetical protein
MMLVVLPHLARINIGTLHNECGGAATTGMNHHGTLHDECGGADTTGMNQH